MEIHDRVVAPFVPVDCGVCMKTNNQKVALFFGIFKEVEMAYMKKIESPRDIDDLIPRSRTLAIAELSDLLRRRKELGTASPRAPSCLILAHILTGLVVDRIFAGALFEMLFRHQQHPSHQISRRHSSGSFHLPEKMSPHVNTVVS